MIMTILYQANKRLYQMNYSRNLTLSRRSITSSQRGKWISVIIISLSNISTILIFTTTDFSQATIIAWRLLKSLQNFVFTVRGWFNFFILKSSSWNCFIILYFLFLLQYSVWVCSRAKTSLQVGLAQI